MPLNLVHEALQESVTLALSVYQGFYMKDLERMLFMSSLHMLLACPDEGSNEGIKERLRAISVDNGFYPPPDAAQCLTILD